MIRFEQLKTGTPRDILATTDDSNAELAEWEEKLAEDPEIQYQTARNLAACQLQGGFASFVIVGDEAGEISELDNDLADFLDELSRKLMEGE